VQFHLRFQPPRRQPRRPGRAEDLGADGPLQLDVPARAFAAGLQVRCATWKVGSPRPAVAGSLQEQARRCSSPRRHLARVDGAVGLDLHVSSSSSRLGAVGGDLRRESARRRGRDLIAASPLRSVGLTIVVMRPPTLSFITTASPRAIGGR